MKKVVIIQKYPIFLIGMVLSIIFSACSYPEDEGKMAAYKLCECEKESFVNDKRVIDLYVEEFNSYSFKTRIEAREKLRELRQKVQTEFDECAKKVEDLRKEKESKYETNPKKAEKFQVGYDTYYKMKSYKPGRDFYGFDRIQTLIETIIPPAPDVEKLKKDLIEKNIFVKDMYYTVSYMGTGIGNYQRQFITWGEGWYTDECWKEIKVLNTTVSGPDSTIHPLNQGVCQFRVYLRLHNNKSGYETKKFNGNVNIKYAIRGADDDWVLERVETETKNHELHYWQPRR